MRIRILPRTALNLVLFVIAGAAAAGSVYLLVRANLKERLAEKKQADDAPLIAKKLESAADAAEKAWNEAYDRRRVTKSDPAETDLLLLDAFLAARHEFESNTNLAKERLPAIRHLQHTLRAAALRKESVATEKKALARDAAGDVAGAEKLYLEALAIEKKIESDYPEADCKSVSRSVMLESRARVLHAKPIWEKSKADETLGDTRYAAGDIPGAVQAYSAAWESQRLLDDRYRGITPADLARTRELGRKFADACAHPIGVKARELAKQTAKLAEAREFDKIPPLRDQAESALREIAEKYPESTFAKASWVDPLRKTLLNAASAGDAFRIEGDLASVAEALRKREFPLAVSLTEGVARDIARVRDQYKGCDNPSQETQDRADYLVAIRNELPLVHEVVNSRIRPFPGRPDLAVWETETTQALYTLVTRGDNPSAVQGDNRPADSITLPEALAFCRKLGWALGRPVRLPSESEFRTLAAATAALPREKLAATARCVDTGDGSALPVGKLAADPNGLKDLLGNVSEWLAEPEGRIAGGDAESTLAQLAETPVTPRRPHLRSRFTGFRFIVENTPAR